MGRRSIWEQIENELNVPREARITLPRSFVQRLVKESTEGPTVSITIPREYAEQILQSLQASLEIDTGDLDDDDLGDPGSEELEDMGDGEFTADDPTGFIDPDSDEVSTGDDDDDSDEDDESESDDEDSDDDEKKPKKESTRRRGRRLWG